MFRETFCIVKIVYLGIAATRDAISRDARNLCVALFERVRFISGFANAKVFVRVGKDYISRRRIEFRDDFGVDSLRGRNYDITWVNEIQFEFQCIVTNTHLDRSIDLFPINDFHYVINDFRCKNEAQASSNVGHVQDVYGKKDKCSAVRKNTIGKGKFMSQPHLVYMSAYIMKITY